MNLQNRDDTIWPTCFIGSDEKMFSGEKKNVNVKSRWYPHVARVWRKHIHFTTGTSLCKYSPDLQQIQCKKEIRFMFLKGSMALLLKQHHYRGTFNIKLLWIFKRFSIFRSMVNVERRMHILRGWFSAPPCSADHLGSTRRDWFTGSQLGLRHDVVWSSSGMLMGRQILHCSLWIWKYSI